MARLFLFSLVAIALALLLTVFYGLPQDPGYLLIAYGNYTFETSLLALISLIIILVLLTRLLFIFFQWVNPGRLFRRDRSKKIAKSKSGNNSV